MECEEIKGALLGKETQLSEAASAHVERCEVCQEVAKDPRYAQSLCALGPPDADMRRLWSEVRLQTQAEGLLDRFKSWPTRRRVWVPFAVLGVVVAFVFWGSRRSDWPVYPRFRLVLELVALTAIFVLSVPLALRPLHRPPLRPWVGVGVALLALGVPLMLAFVGPAHLDHPASIQGGGADLWSRALACFKMGGILGAVLLGVTLAMARHRVHLGVGVASFAALGAVAGVLALQFHCPITLKSHLLLGHVSLPGVFMLLGYLYWWRKTW